MKRELEKILNSRLKTWRSVALLGARQVGKSYLLAEILKKHEGNLISFDDPLERQEAQGDPLKYLEQRYKVNKYLFIDEAARVPEIFSAVKILVDRYGSSPSGICLANSGNYLLLRRIKESLAGRVNLLSIYPLSWSEFSKSERLPGLVELIEKNIPQKIEFPESLVSVDRMREERMLWGGFPIVSLTEDCRERILWIQDYIRTYILPLVVEQFNIRDSFAFERICRILFLHNGQFLNVNKLAQNASISQPTAMDYIHYLEAMMVIKHVPVFFRNLKKRIIKQPKIYVCDSLLFNEALGFNFSIQKAVELGIIGSIYESFIFNELQKFLSNYDMLAEIFTWRTQDKAEVDIVLSTSEGIVPIEIKWSTQLTSKDTTGLQAFMDCYPEVKKGYIIYPGRKLQKITENIFAVPDWWIFGCY